MHYKPMMTQNELQCLPNLCSNQYSVAKLLLDKGSDVNRIGYLGVSPVHMAAALGFSRILGLLLQQPNCKINIQVQYTHVYMLQLHVA